MDGGSGSEAAQYRAVQRAVTHVVALIKKGWNVVLTHGNGPQVGALLQRSEQARDKVPPMGLDTCVAATQATIGFLFQRALTEALQGTKPVVTLITQVEVDPDDPGFTRPTKPIGPFLSEEQARMRQLQDSWQVVEDSRRGWRRVVASPRPLHILELEAIQTLASQGFVVVAAGGGGIPVTRQGHSLRGRAAVIDKDRTSALLAIELKAEVWVCATAVDKVCLDFGTDQERPLDTVTAAEARRYLAEGQFPPGSMGPKIEAALDFLEGGGRRALITSLEGLAQAADGQGGTEFLP